MYSFSHLESVCCSMSSSNCYFLACMQISQEAGQVVWYSHLLKNFPVCCDPHKGFGVVNKAEVYVFLEPSCFFDDPRDVGYFCTIYQSPFIKLLVGLIWHICDNIGSGWVCLFLHFVYCISHIKYV